MRPDGCGLKSHGETCVTRLLKINELVITKHQKQDEPVRIQWCNM